MKSMLSFAGTAALAATVGVATLSGSAAHAVTMVTVNDVQTRAAGPGAGGRYEQSYTVDGSINSPLLVVGVAIEEQGIGSGISGSTAPAAGVSVEVTYGDTTLTTAVEQFFDDGTNDGYSGLFYLPTPTVDSQQTVQVAILGFGNVDTLVFTTYTLSDINQLDPIGDTGAASSTNAGTRTVSLTSQSADSLLIANYMTGEGDTNKLSVNAPLTTFSTATLGTGSTVAQLSASADGGPLGTSTDLSINDTSSLRAVLVGAEFQAIAAIPEPASLALLGAGTLCLLGGRRRQA